jgi:hypothetical protein
MTSQLPHRFREEQFRRFESLITNVVKSFPVLITIIPRSIYNMSPETFRSRFKDSLRSLKEFRWPTTVPMEKFDNIVDNIMVRAPLTGVIVHIGDKNTTLDPKPTYDYVKPVTASAVGLTFTNPTPQEVFTLVKLAEGGQLVAPQRLVGVQEMLLQTYYDAHDISYEKQEDGSFLLS